MGLINFTVYCNSSKRVLLPWQISRVHPPSVTFQGYFHQELSAKCPDGFSLSQVYVGKGKYALDFVDLELVILEVTSLFGPFVKYTVDQSSTEPMEVDISLSFRLIVIFCFCGTAGETWDQCILDHDECTKRAG